MNSKVEIYPYFKLVADWVTALFLFIVCLPIFLVIAIFLLPETMGKVLFIHDRQGYKNRVFGVVKFRTLILVGDDPLSNRPGPIGKYLRRLKLDELPQLFNILAGQMSFVGPRPLPLEYFEKMSFEHRGRYDVKPGITGLTQINGGNKLSWEKRFELDIKYVRKRSLWIDLYILISTLPVVLGGKTKDVSERFTGY